MTTPRITALSLRRWPPDLSALPLEHQIRPHTHRFLVSGKVEDVQDRFLTVQIERRPSYRIQVAMPKFLEHGLKPGDRISEVGVLGRRFRGPIHNRHQELTFFVRPREEPQDDGNPFATHETRFGVLGTPEAMDESVWWTTALGERMRAQQMSDSHLAHVLQLILRQTLLRLAMGDRFKRSLARPEDAKLFLTVARSRFLRHALKEWERRKLPWWGTFQGEAQTT